MTLTKGSLDFTCVKKVVNLKAVSGDIQFKTLLHNKGIALEFVVCSNYMQRDILC